MNIEHVFCSHDVSQKTPKIPKPKSNYLVASRSKTMQEMEKLEILWPKSIIIIVISYHKIPRHMN